MSRTPRPLSEIATFDPQPSIRLALDLLSRAKVPYALCGRIAVWAWVDPKDQEFTKDVDFAVARADTERLEEVVRAAGYQPLPLSIGGFGIRAGDLRVDFIDRRVDFELLFAEAVQAAARDSTVTLTADGTAVHVVPLAHLVAMKIATGERKDEDDVRRLLRVADVDYAGIRSVVRKHAGPGTANRLDRIAVEVGLAAARRYVGGDADP